MVAFLISTLTFLLALCCPYFGIVYGCALLVLYIYNKRKKEIKIWNCKGLYICLSITFIYVLLYSYLFVLKKYSISKVIETIHFIFDDPEHYFSFSKRVYYVCGVLYRLALKCPINSIVLILSFVLCLSKKHKQRYKLTIFMLACIGFLFALASYVIHALYGTFNYEIIDISMLGIIAFMLLDKKPWELFLSFSTVGFILIITDCFLSSNTSLHEFSVDILIVGVGSIIYIVELFKELTIYNIRFSKIFLICCNIVLSFQLFAQAYTRINRQYWDMSIPEMTSTIQVGANKGLKTTPELKASYTLYFNNLKTLLGNVELHDDDKFLSLSRDPIIYLDASMQFGTFSAWTIGYNNDDLIAHLCDYYMHTPDKVPDYIFAKTEDDITENMNWDGYKRYEYNGSVLYVNQGKL